MTAPHSRTRRASSRLARGLTVLRSTQIFPGSRPARIPSGPGRHGLKHPVIGQRREHDVGRRGDLAWGVAPAQALLLEVLRVLSGSILTVSGYPAARNRAAMFAPHVPKADEAECRGCCRGHLLDPALNHVDVVLVELKTCGLVEPLQRAADYLLRIARALGGSPRSTPCRLASPTSSRSGLFQSSGDTASAGITASRRLRFRLASVQPEPAAELPHDVERFAVGLEDDRKLHRARLIAGVLSEMALIGLFITSLQGAGL